MQKKLLTFGAMLILLVGLSHAQIRIVHVDPATDQITFENKGAIEENVGNKILCARFDYTFGTIANETTLISGTLIMPPGGSVTVEWTDFVDNGSSDMAIYSNTAFTDPDAMLDFMQYGGGGIGREGIAVMAGLWTAGDFVENPGPFMFTGNATDTGVGFWDNGTVGILSVQELNNLIQMNGNRVSDQLVVNHTIEDYELFELSIISITGQLVKQEQINATQNQVEINVQSLQSGMYFMRFNVDGSILVKKFFKR